MAFSVTCPSCGKSFQLAQEIYDRKVAGKVVSIKCKQCQVGIRIDATEPGALKVLGATPIAAGSESVGAHPPAAAAPKPQAGAPAAAANPPRARQATLLGMMGPGGTPITKASAPEPAQSETALWAVDSGGTGEDRELDDLTIGREIAAGRISPTTLVWRDGMSDWLEVAKIPQLARLLPKAKADPPKVSAPLPAARAKQPSAPGIAAPASASARLPATSAPIITEADEEEATMIYKSSPDAAEKYGLAGLPAEQSPLPAAPRPAAGRPAAVRAPLPAPPPAPSPLVAAAPPPPAPPPPVAAAAPLPAPPPPIAAATLPLAPPAAAAPPPPPPSASAPLAPAPPPPPSPPPPPATGAPAPPAPVPPPMRPKQASAPGFAKGLTPPPPLAAAPAPPPVPSPPPPAPSVGAPPFIPTANPYATPASAAHGAGMAQLAPGPFAVPTTTDIDFPAARSKTPLIVGGIVLVLAVAGIAIAVTRGGSPPAPPPVPTEALSPPATTTTATTATNTPVPDAPQATGGPPDDIAGKAPAPAGTDFSQMFAQGAEKAQKGGTSEGAKPFDAEEARTAVAGVLKAVAACKEAGGAIGQSSAAVTFEASGHVSSVTIGAPFSGTSTGTCIITAFKAAKVTPFSGLPGTVSQPVSLQ